MFFGIGSKGDRVILSNDVERFPCFTPIGPSNFDIVAGSFVARTVGTEGAFMSHDFSEGPSVELPISFSLVLAFNDIRQFIVSHDLFIGIITNIDEELDVLVILSITVQDFVSHLGTNLLPRVGFAKEGESHQLIRQELGQFQS